MFVFASRAAGLCVDQEAPAVCNTESNLGQLDAEESNVLDDQISVSLLQTRMQRVRSSSLLQQFGQAEHEGDFAIGGSSNSTCHPSTDKGCSSMCLNLKMTDDKAKDGEADDSNSCPLFEWSMKSCGYTMPESREKKEENPMDCAVNILRMNVMPAEINATVKLLEKCVEDVPAEDAGKCRAGFTLIKNEIIAWNAEMALKMKAKDLRKTLYIAITKAGAAFKTKSNEQDAIDALSGALELAEDLPGHYLTEDIYTAREFLDKLGPIPPVRAELEAAIRDSKSAMNEKAFYQVRNAVVRLNVSIVGADEMNLGTPLPAAKQLLKDLGELSSVLVNFKDSIADANISLGTKTGMGESITALNSSLIRAELVGLTDQVPLAKGMLKKLVKCDTALENLKQASGHGRMVLTAGHQGLEPLSDAILWLNSTVAQAEAFSVGDDELILTAVETLDTLKYIHGSRAALHTAIEHAMGVLANNSGVLSDDAEETAIAVLEPAVEWGEDVGLENGLPVGKDLMKQLKNVESAKEDMARSLAHGNSSLNAKAGEDEAIRVLTMALERFDHLNLTASVPEANHELDALKVRKTAKTHLQAATAAARRSLRSRSGEVEAISGLNASIHEVNRTGLRMEADIGYKLLLRLINTLEAKRRLTDALGKAVPLRKVKMEGINDTVPKVTFNRTGYAPQELPVVLNGTDDGDADFEEHILSLNMAIEGAKLMGVIDPAMEMQLEHMHRMKEAFSSLTEAIQAGSGTMASKHGVDASISLLATATKEAKKEGLSLKVDHAEHLLHDLRRIQPARQEIEEAILQGNISVNTVNHMAEAILRLGDAVKVSEGLDLPYRLDEAKALLARLNGVKEAYVDLKAAIVQGEISIDREEGEEAAISELEQSIGAAEEVDMHREVPVAVDLLQELMHMNADHQKMATAIDKGADKLAA